MKDLPELFGSMVFNDAVMKARLPKDIYKALRKTILGGTHLELDVANVVANAMKDWATEKGATHYTHWFQPMTGVTAEKHDSFVSPDGSGGIILEFSGKELVKGEPDASSFPSGGLRATFEARGYTAWDPSSYAFIKDGTLCIPTAFCSYSGEVLDKKTPLLKSMEALSKQALRIVKLFGNSGVSRVITTVGPEQEYFLIDKDVYAKRADLLYCGRTLFGAKPPKGQELEDHYFGNIKSRVSEYMKDLDKELWKLGVLSKTKHNEVAPGQHEMAPVFGTTNIAADHNQIVMETMKSVAAKHGMVCLLHEKPFAGVNGSGKHNNWSMSTDTGANLLEPGDTPYENAQFLLFLVAVIKAVDEYQDLLRVSVATAGNDHRLGANEAPPAIVSMFLGEELTGILDAIKNGTPYAGIEKISMQIGAKVLPHFPKDTTDRNRTSSFAFTGNKFEFRMLGSSASISGANIVLNSIVADVLEDFANELEGSKNFKDSLAALVTKTIQEHDRIIFNGNGYDDSWVLEAEKRGLKNLRTTPDALPAFVEQRNIDMFVRQGVFSEAEVRSRYEIMCESYCKTIQIEALTMVEMIKKDVLPSVAKYEKEIAKTILAKKDVSKSIPCAGEEKMLESIAGLFEDAHKKLDILQKAIDGNDCHEVTKETFYMRDSVFAAMQELRLTVDELESCTSRECWTLPTYGEILYSVK
ncbi:MAG: glutamine synthetase III [Spirochaetales bacterium]